MSRTIDGLITQINRDYGAACVVVTHDLAGALRYAHRIAFLKNGRFLEVTTPEAILTSQQPDIQAFLAAQSIEVHHGK
jgi:ABC-type transporter Mla maintaining outer membrane lipid asymmetry ATPase subunit MlaF